MAIDKKFIGKEYPPIKYEVSKEKIKEYAIATGDLNPLYINPEEAKNSKYGGIIAMPMFIVVCTLAGGQQVIQDNELALDLSRILHGEQEFEFLGIIKPNDVITTKYKIANIYSKEGKSGKLEFVEVESLSKNQDDKLVCKGKWTFVIRG